jgi:hypothetical protein
MQRTRKHANFAASLRECASLGSLVDLSVADSVDDEDVDIEIERIGGVHESSIFELSNGLTGCMLEAGLTNQAKRRKYPREIHLRLPWIDLRVDWVVHSDFYRFPGKDSLELPRDQVLNHVVLAPSGLEPQRFHEGWFVAIGGPMPKTLRHGQWVNATLAIITSDHVECSATFSLWTDRLETRPERAARKCDLFGEPVGHDIDPLVAARAEARRGE